MVSGKSGLSSKTYVTHLEKKLDNERVAREKLEEELEELKRISMALSRRLKMQGLSKQKKKAKA